MIEETTPLCTLVRMLGERGKDSMYPCIRDLLEHGLDPSRFCTADLIPNRQDITQYLGAWSRHAGLREEESGAWLIDYCVTTIARLSRKTPAAIRHSTKGNLRYIYRSAVPFQCQGANNSFRAQCGDCTLHADMGPATPRGPFSPKTAALMALPLPRPGQVKEAFQEQFKESQSLIREEVQKGTPPVRILEILQERGLKTKTGRQWQTANLRLELQSLKGGP